MKFKEIFESSKPYSIGEIYNYYAHYAREKNIKFEIDNGKIIITSKLPANDRNNYVSIEEIKPFFDKLGIIKKIENKNDIEIIKTEYNYTIKSKKQRDGNYKIEIK